MDHNRQLVHRFYEELWNRPDESIIPDIMTPGVTFRGSLGSVKTGHNEFADYVRRVTGALESYHCDLQTLLVEGDQAAARLMFSGVHSATFLGVAPTGRLLAWAGAAFFTFADGLVSDLWVLGDLQALNDQLAVSP
jgi:predicted ester cyclase